MTKWEVCRQRNTSSLPIWRACRTVNGALELDEYTFGTQGQAQIRVDELNAKEKAPEAAATAQGAEK